MLDGRYNKKHDDQGFGHRVFYFNGLGRQLD